MNSLFEQLCLMKKLLGYTWWRAAREPPSCHTLTLINQIFSVVGLVRSMIDRPAQSIVRLEASAIILLLCIMAQMILCCCLNFASTAIVHGCQLFLLGSVRCTKRPPIRHARHLLDHHRAVLLDLDACTYVRAAMFVTMHTVGQAHT